MNNSQIIYSFGVICFRFVFDKETNTIKPQYLMIQRKDSICFIEFIRGKYNIFDFDYIKTLFKNMTVEEITLIKLSTFDCLWKKIWVSSKNNEYERAKSKFNMLKYGFSYFDGHVHSQICISNITNKIKCYNFEQDWEFPKGRKNNYENYLMCALREFEEEAGIKQDEVTIIDTNHVEFVKLGCNQVLYKFWYYIGKCNCEIGTSINRIQAREVKNVKWFDYKDAFLKLQNIQQKQAFEKVNLQVIQRAME